MKLDRRTRWLALYVLCLGDLMIVLDATIVNSAIPLRKTRRWPNRSPSRPPSSRKPPKVSR